MPTFLSHPVGAAMLGLALTLSGPAVHASDAASFPTKAITIVVPYSPGGPSDTMARMIADALQADWDKPVIVENRPGASGVVASEYVLRQPADGYTLLVITATHAFLDKVMPKLSYQPLRDFTGVAGLNDSKFMLLASPNQTADSLAAVIQRGTNGSPPLNFGMVGIVGMGRMAYESFRDLTSIQGTAIPYPGSAPMVTAIAGGQVDFALDVVGPYIPMVTSGKLKALAVTGTQRNPALPQVPTFAEAGLAAYDFSMWSGVVVRSGTPPAIIDKLATAINSAMATPKIQAHLQRLALEPMPTTPESFAALLQDSANRFSSLIARGHRGSTISRVGPDPAAL